MDITATIFLTIDTKELYWCYLFNVRYRGRNGNRNGSRIVKNISFVLLRFITILLCLDQSYTLVNSADTLISEFSGTKRVESSANLMSLLLLDNEFKSWDKTKNNVGPKSEPCRKPRNCTTETTDEHSGDQWNIVLNGDPKPPQTRSGKVGKNFANYGHTAYLKNAWS